MLYPVLSVVYELVLMVGVVEVLGVWTLFEMERAV